MRQNKHRWQSALCLALALTAPAVAAPPEQIPTEKINKKIDNVTLADAGALYNHKGKEATVVVFLSFECPVSNSYAPVLAELANAYADKGVRFIGIQSGEDADPVQLKKHAAEFKLPFAVIVDPEYKAADAFKAAFTPEAFLLDHNFVLRYRGRIDDGYYARLKKNATVRRHDLKEALDQLLAGQPIAEPATRAVGCPVRRDGGPNAAGRVTYYRDVLPILQAHCQQCHRPGEVGPFSLITLKQAVAWAADIKEYTQDRKMPPWKPVDGAAFHNDRRLSEKELATLAAWVDGGTPAGDPKVAPPPRQFTDGWQLGKPDLVLTVPEEMTVGPAGRDLFRVFVLPTGLTEDRYVTAIEVRPANKRVVHHTLNFIDRTGQARQMEKKERERVKSPDEQDHGPGYSVSMGVGFIPQGALGGWAPGQMSRTLPAGTGYHLPRGSDVVVQVHYHRDGRVEKDRVSIGLYFAKQPVKYPFKGAVIPGRFLAIPAGDSSYAVKGAIEVEQDITLHSVMPHMHMLGRAIKVTLTPPAGEARTLIAIKDWDYNWQETYFLKEPIVVKAGTKLAVEAVYDNSDKNPMNPFHPPRPVRFGEQTDNEMCFVFLGAVSDSPGRIKVKRLDAPLFGRRLLESFRPPATK
jgi:thiol-disulfide isomerase/thioredoxin